MKLKGVYENNPAMGDPLSVEGQLADNGVKLEKLQNELQKFQVSDQIYYPILIC